MLSLDIVCLGVPDVQAADAFYSAALSPAASDQGAYTLLDLRGAGQVALYNAEALAGGAHIAPATSGFRGYIMSYIVKQPSEVQAVLDAASRGGATILKPGKKGFFGGFSGTFQAPDGSVWKVSAPTKKDTGPAASPPVPTETVCILGVASPKVSRDFYIAMGMAVDLDYGDKFIDFKPATGTTKLGLMTRKALAKDVGVSTEGSGFRGMVMTRRGASRAEVDELLEKAAAAGGEIALPAAETDDGYAGHIVDPDGVLWKVVSA